jgi:putative sterol carrier protein
VAKFLSEEFMTEASETLSTNPGFQNAISNVELGVQFNVTDGPDGDVAYYLDIADGNASMELGELGGADVTLTSTYETFVGISKGELNTQMAFMTGKLKVSGNMAKLMMNQAVFSQFTAALSGMDVQY